MTEAKVLGLLGIANRAGRLITGEELTVKAIQRNQARLVLIASDASPNLTKKIQDKARSYEIPCNQSLSEFELSKAIGKNRKVLAVVDAGFAKKMENLLMM